MVVIKILFIGRKCQIVQFVKELRLAAIIRGGEAARVVCLRTNIT